MFHAVHKCSAFDPIHICITLISNEYVGFMDWSVLQRERKQRSGISVASAVSQLTLLESRKPNELNNKITQTIVIALSRHEIKTTMCFLALI